MPALCVSIFFFKFFLAKVQDKVSTVLGKGQLKCQCFLQSACGEAYGGISAAAVHGGQEVPPSYALNLSYSSYTHVITTLSSFQVSCVYMLVLRENHILYLG